MPEEPSLWPIHVYTYGEAYDDQRMAFFLDVRDYASSEAGRVAAAEAAAAMRGTGVIYEETSYQDYARSPDWLTWEQFKRRHFVDGVPLPVRRPLSRTSRPPGWDAMHTEMRDADEALQAELVDTFASCLPGSKLSFNTLYGPMRRSAASIHRDEEKYGFEVRADVHGFGRDISNAIDLVSAELTSRAWQLGPIVPADDGLPPALDRYGVRDDDRLYFSVRSGRIHVIVESRLYRAPNTVGTTWVTEIRRPHPDAAAFYPGYVEPAPEPDFEPLTSTAADSSPEAVHAHVEEPAATATDESPPERDEPKSPLPPVAAFARAPRSSEEASARLRVCEIHFAGKMTSRVRRQLMELLELKPPAGGEAVILGTRELPVAGCRGRLQLHYGNDTDRWHLDMRIDRLRVGVEPTFGDDAEIAAECADIARMIVTLLEHFGFLVWDLVARPKSLLAAISSVYTSWTVHFNLAMAQPVLDQLRRALSLTGTGQLGYRREEEFGSRALMVAGHHATLELRRHSGLGGWHFVVRVNTTDDVTIEIAPLLTELTKAIVAAGSDIREIRKWPPS